MSVPTFRLEQIAENTKDLNKSLANLKLINPKAAYGLNKAKQNYFKTHFEMEHESSGWLVGRLRSLDSAILYLTIYGC